MTTNEGLSESGKKRADSESIAYAEATVMHDLLSRITGKDDPVFGNPLALVLGVGNLFFPADFSPRVDRIPDVSDASKRFLTYVARPALADFGRNNSDEMGRLSHSFGRLVGGLVIMSALKVPQPFKIMTNQVQSDGLTIRLPMRRDVDNVIDFGMGIGGLVAHKTNLTKKVYSLKTVARSETNAKALQGAAETLGIPAGSMDIFTGSIPEFVKSIDATRRNEVDRSDAVLVMASKVHVDAGLGMVVNRLPRLLRKSGVFIARGPSLPYTKKGYSYLLSLLERMPAMDVENSDVQIRTLANGETVEHTTIFARYIDIHV